VKGVGKMSLPMVTLSISGQPNFPGFCWPSTAVCVPVFHSDGTDVLYGVRSNLLDTICTVQLRMDQEYSWGWP
jgi:hypothetical protein